MKKRNRYMVGLAALLCLAVCLLLPIEADAVSYPEGWYQDMKGWYYISADGDRLTDTWAKDSRGWCYLDAKGYRVVNTWKKDSVGWCYLGTEGFMVTDQWVKDSVGWCYVDTNGYMATNRWVKDSVGWCYVGADGYCVANQWKRDSVGWCYLDANGRMATNKWIKDSVGWCYVGANGYMVYSRWVKDSVGWCYVGSNGYMVTNKWVTDSKGWCYIGANGYAITNQWKRDSVGWCYLDSQGSMVKSAWVKDNGYWYYLDGNGYMVTGWKTIGDYEYYFYTNGIMAASTTVDGKYLNENGQHVAMLSVGYGRKDITPFEAVPMAGYGDEATRLCMGFLTYLNADCVAVTDAPGNTVLLISVDLYDSKVASLYIGDISKATGVDAANIFICATGSVNAPATSYTESEAIVRYNEQLKKALVEAAQAAMEDRKPAEQYIAAVEAEGLNFVNRYVCADGSYCGDNYASATDGVPLIAHETAADAQLQLVKFVRNGSQDIILANFQVQVKRAGKQTSICHDVVGAFRDKLRQELECNVIYFNGASGNLNPVSRFLEENICVDWREHGQAMAQCALKCEGNYRKLEGGKVQVSTFAYEAQVDHTEDQKIAQAMEVCACYENGGTSDEVMQLCREYGFSSYYHAKAVVKKAAMPATMSIPISAVTIGNVGFVAAPCQLFDTTGVQIKESSPYYMTIIATGVNGDLGHVPSKLAFENGGYEPDVSRFVAGTAEALAQKYCQMLDALCGNP